MLDRIIRYSIHHKLIVLLFSALIVGFGLYSLSQIPIGAVPDVTNNQVQIITTSRNLATEDVEKFLTYPVELEMANLPGVKEIRSVSKFGLSVVTVVFNDRIGTYLPFRLIAGKIKSAEEKIPAGFGKPFMGPISRGLGKIKFRVQNNPSSLYHARVHLVNPSIDRAERTFNIHAHLADSSDPSLFVPGMYVEAEIFIRSHDGLALPQEAVVESDGRKYVLVLSDSTDSELIYEKREVITGASGGEYYEILNAGEFNEDARFLINGAFDMISE